MIDCLVFSQIHYSGMANIVMFDEVNNRIEENKRRKNFVAHNRRFNR